MLRRACLLLLLCGAAASSRPAQAAGHAVIPAFERLDTADKADLARGGRLLLGELGCVSCHLPSEKSLTAKQAPVLDHVGTRVRIAHLRKFLTAPHKAKPGTAMPDVLAADAAKRKEQVEALVHFLASTGTPTHQRPQVKLIPAGRNLYREVGCVACHGTRDDKAAAGTTTAATVPLGDLSAKYTVPSLAAFLEQPLHARPAGRMPKLLDAAEAREVATYLLQGLNLRLAAGLGATRYSYYEGNFERLPDFARLKPKRGGTAPGFELSVASRPANYAVVFEGAFRAVREAEHTFHVGSDDGSRLYVDGRLVVDNDGTHPMVYKSGKVKLTKGAHKVRVEFFQGGGGAELEVTVATPGLKPVPLGDVVAVDEKALDAKPPVREADDDALELKPELAKKGRELFAALGCASCHQLKADGRAIESSLRAPALGKLAGQGGCISGKGEKGAPRYALSAKQAAALARGLAARPGEMKPADRVAATMAALNCYACHVRGQTGGVEPALDQFILSTQPEMGDEGRLPPPLDGVGAKLVPEMFRSILDAGAKHRPYMRTRMPGFGAANAGHLAADFAAIDKLPAVAAHKFTEAPGRVKARGRHLVGGEAFSCIKCHTFNGQRAEGVQGIDMALMPKRVTREWFHAYISEPQKIRPGTRMPAIYLEGKSPFAGIFAGSGLAQTEAMWLYLKDGASAAVPLGMGAKSIPLVPTDGAIIYRNFVAGAGARAIAVGYPEKAHLAFDGNELRLAMIWHGAFIDAAKHWTERGSGWQGPLGDNVLRLHGGAPFAVLAKGDAPWPAEPAKKLGWRLKGYRLAKDDRPTFLYAMDGLSVEDFPNPVPMGKDHDPHLRRTLLVSATKRIENVYYRAAVGERVEEMTGGWYRVDAWKIKVSSAAKPVVRKAGGRSELLVPVTFAEGKAKVVVEYAW